IPQRPGITPPWNHCGAGILGRGNVTQRILWLTAPHPLYEGTEQSDAQVKIAATARKASCSGPGQPLSPTQAQIRRLSKACLLSDAAGWYHLGQMLDLQSHNQFQHSSPLRPISLYETFLNAQIKPG